MYLLKLFPLLIILIFYFPSLNGQALSVSVTDAAVSISDSEYTVQRFYDTDYGLPANGITYVIQDSKGYIWASTFNGLLRYDGYRFRIYDMDSVDGLTSNRFLTVMEGSDGKIYAGLEFGDLLIIDGNKFDIYHLNHEEFTANISFNALYEDDNGKIWIGTEAGLIYFENGQFIREESSVFDEIDTLTTQMIYRYDGDIYVLFSGAIVKYDSEIEEFIVLATLDVDNHSITYLDNNVTTSQQKSGRFWQVEQTGEREFILIHEDGIFELSEWGIRTLLDRYEIQTQVLHGIKYFNNRTYVYGSDGLFSTDDLFSENREYIRHNNVSISYVLNDDEGNLWLASHAYGLIHLKETPVYGGDRFEPVSHVPATAILGGSDGSLYIGTNCDELYAFQADDFIKYGQNDGITNRCIWSLMEQSDGTIWAGTWGEGVFRKRTDENHFELFRPEAMKDVIAVLSLFEDSKGNIWFGSYYNGLYKFDGEKVQLIYNQNGQPMSAVRMLYEDGKGNIYVASDRGIGILNEDFQIEKPEKLKITRTLNFRTILQDDYNRFWFGSYGGGIIIMDGNEIYTLSRDNGLYDNTVSQINFDSSGNLWLAGNMGISVIEQEQIESFLNGNTNRVRVARIGQQDGLVVGETTGGFTPSSYLNEYNELYIPTVRGLVKIDTDRFQMNQKIPEIYLEDVEVDGRVFSPDEFEGFSYKDRRLIFRFSILSFKNPDHVEFDYLLDGFDEHWRRASGSREVVYTSLPQGNYTLRIRGSNNDGFWNDAGVSFSFQVKPPFWTTLWFYSLISILLIAIVYGSYRYRVANIKRINLELEKKVNQRTIELESANKELKQLVQEKNKMQRVLGHDLRNPLAGIIGYLELLKSEDSFSENEEHAEIMLTLLDSSRNTMELLENLIQFSGISESGLKPTFEKRNIKELAEEAIKIIEVQASQKEIGLILKCDGLIQADVDSNMILSVFRNLISNAVKYSPNGSHVTIVLEESESDDKVYIRVIDKGIGMDTDQLNSLFSENSGISQRGTMGEKGMGIGLQICKDFVDKHNGTIEVESQRGSGSTFLVKLPKKQ